MYDMNVKASILIFRELLSPLVSEPSDVRYMATFFADMQRQKWGKVYLCHVALWAATS